MFIENKYTKLYYAIIKSSQLQKDRGYTERHHILPKCLGGDNTKSNIVRLSARKHFICHKLLVKMVSGQAKYKMIEAVAIFSNNSKRKLNFNSRDIALIREANALASSKRKKRIKSACLQELKISPECSRVEIKRASAGGRSQFYSIRFRFLRGNRCLADVNQSFLFSRANWLKRIGISFVTDSDGNRTMILPHFRSRTFGLHEPESEIDETVPEMYSQEVQSSGALSSHQQQPIYQPQETRGGASSSSWQPMHQEQTTYQPEIQPSQWLQPLYANQDPQQILPMGVQIGVPMTFPGFMALLVPVPAQMVYTTQQQQFPEPGLTLVPTQARGNDDYFEEQDF